jgi:ABC-2 type transport system ATP-binding protein
VPGVASVTALAEGPSYRVELSAAAAVPTVLSLLVTSGVASIRTSRPSLEEVYLRLIGSKPPI